MSESLADGQDAVNSAGGSRAEPEIHPYRTSAGAAFTSFVVAVAALGHEVTAIGEALARVGGQTLARWVVLDAIASRPAPVATIAKDLGQARQSVQRVADLLVADDLAQYAPNPSHRRAHLLVIGEPGRRALDAIDSAQAAWANPLGEAIGEKRLYALIEELREVRQVFERGNDLW